VTAPKHSAGLGSRRRTNWVRSHLAVVTCVAVVIAVVVAVFVLKADPSAHMRPSRSAQPMHYLGVYQPDAPRSYAGIDQFAQAIGRQPNLVCYYSNWREPFQAGFATLVARHGAELLIQINPAGVSLAAISGGQYDGYLRSYAAAVRSYGRPIIVSFGHEMNGSWYPWGYLHTSPTVFVAAWRHIVTEFRAGGASNVRWLWTVNIINTSGNIPDPAPWWPGASFVNLVGIDGYYFKPSWLFAPLFGPTIRAVHALTRDPILIAETGAGRIAGQPTKIANLFAGIRDYRLLGFVWFDGVAIQDWRLHSAAAVDAFRRAANTYMRKAVS
jgi:mannan endo-1,4-beta-mannosidase